MRCPLFADFEAVHAIRVERDETGDFGHRVVRVFVSPDCIVGARADNAVWTYEHPHDAVAEIAGFVAFYPDRVDSLEIRE